MPAFCYPHILCKPPVHGLYFTSLRAKHKQGYGIRRNITREIRCASSVRSAPVRLLMRWMPDERAKRNGYMKPLTHTEQIYLDTLRQRSPDVVSRSVLSQLGECMTKYARTSNIVDAHVRNIRTKTKGSAFKIVTVRGSGYQLVSTI